MPLWRIQTEITQIFFCMMQELHSSDDYARLLLMIHPNEECEYIFA